MPSLTDVPAAFPWHPSLLVPSNDRSDITYSGWEATLGGLQSFYVAGANSELSSNGLPDVKFVYKHWPRAYEILKSSSWIDAHLRWSDRIAYQQFLRAQKGNAVLFAKAASIILTYAVASEIHNGSHRVFDTMQIIPACFYVEGFDDKKLTKIRRVSPSFIRDALQFMKQSNETLILDMSKGHGVTRRTAELLRRFIVDHFPDELIGNVSARQVRRQNGFATRNASTFEIVEL